MGGEGARCRRGQGALTSPARHSRGSRLHVPRASPARSTSLRRARARAPGSRVRFFVPAHARPILTDRVRGPLAANRRRRHYLSPPHRNLARTAPFPCPRGLGLEAWAACGFKVPVLRVSLFSGAPTCPLRLARQAARGCALRDSFRGCRKPSRLLGAAGTALRPPYQ